MYLTYAADGTVSNFGTLRRIWDSEINELFSHVVTYLALVPFVDKFAL